MNTIIDQDQIVCKKCGSVNDYFITISMNNHMAYCRGCGSYIKNIPYNPPALYFGKYAGKPIKEFDGKEIEYLYWIRNHPEIWPKLNKRTQDAINLRLDGHL